MRAVGKADRRRGAADLLHRHGMFEIAEARAAPLLLDRDAMQAELAHLRPELTREPVLAVDLLGQRRDPVLCETVHRLADRIGRLAEIEVEGTRGVGEHVETSGTFAPL